MLKLYVLYFSLGIYVFYYQLLVWAFSSGDIITYLAHYSSILLFVFASVLSLFRIKLASLIGLVCLMGLAPFAIYWIFNPTYTFVEDQGLLFHLVLGIAIILYVIAIFYSIRVLINYKKPITATNLKKPIKILLAVVPIVLLLLYTGLENFDR